MPSHFIAFWNLENLFAPEGFADREPWIAKRLASDLKGWTQQLYGTLYFNGNGNVFDQLFVSKGLLIENNPITVSEDTARIEVFPEMVDHRVSHGPIRFGLSKGNAAKNVNTSGFSDHFPVSVILQEQ